MAHAEQQEAGTAPVQGENQAPQAESPEEPKAQEQSARPEKPEKSVPYSRFQQVNEQKKAAEETLKGVVDDLLDEIPEDMRDIIPDLSPAEKIKWIRLAQKKGLFGAAPVNGPDSERPGGKPPQNLNGMTPYAKMATGYKF